jgi:hypothetical protein
MILVFISNQFVIGEDFRFQRSIRKLPDTIFGYTYLIITKNSKLIANRYKYNLQRIHRNRIRTLPDNECEHRIDRNQLH